MPRDYPGPLWFHGPVTRRWSDDRTQPQRFSLRADRVERGALPAGSELLVIHSGHERALAGRMSIWGDFFKHPVMDTTEGCIRRFTPGDQVAGRVTAVGEGWVVLRTLQAGPVYLLHPYRAYTSIVNLADLNLADGPWKVGDQISATGSWLSPHRVIQAEHLE